MARKFDTSDEMAEAIGLTKTSDGQYELLYQDKYPNHGRDLPGYFCKALVPEVSFFEKLGKPGSSDWLANHKETGQTFESYIKGGLLRPTSRRKVMYLLPLVFEEDPIPSEVLEPLQKFASVFFGLEVKIMQTENLKGKVADRIHFGVYQVNAQEVLKCIGKALPPDAFCVAGITFCDLYPKNDWNFVFGFANLSGRCGVYSLARYLTNFGKYQHTKYEPEQETGDVTILSRSCKTMCHEMGHMFGLKHCIYFSCIMNGSNHLDESDTRSIFLCPVCLRKLHFACQFDIRQRYVEMEQFWKEQKSEVYVDWLHKRIQFMDSSVCVL